VAFAFVYVGVVYLTLPDVRPLATANPDTTAFIELRGRQARAEGRTPRRVQRWVGYGRIAPQLKRAVLVAEDSAFWEHQGIDLEQIRESLEVNLERFELSRGASTITQQLAKNLYLSPSKNPVRKFRELLLARHLEAALSKRRIFELYLNVIEWGDGIYGVDAAARAYFGVPAERLSAEQSALLAATIINPRALRPSAPTQRLLARQRLILRRMGGGRSFPADVTATPPVSLPAPSAAQPGVEAPVETPPPDSPVPRPFPGTVNK
jgi:monofunctional glycosyltransferase